MDITVNGNIQPGQIDVKGMVQELMVKEQQPLTELQQADNNDKTQVSAFFELQSLLGKFQSTLDALTTALNPTYNVTSSNTSLVTAGVTGASILPITHTVTVQQLAQAESIASTPFNSTTAGLGVTDTLGVTVGSANFNVNVLSTDSLTDIVTKINNSASANNVGVSASVVAVAGNQFQLVISSNLTGLANKVTLSESPGTPLGLTTELTAARNAQFTFDTLNMEESSNNITDAASGLSFTLLATTGVGQSVNLNVSGTNPLSETVKGAIQTTLDAYNQIIGFIDQAQVDPSLHNNIFDYVKTNLQNTLNTALTSGTFKTLDSIGIVPSRALKLTTTITTTDLNGQEKQQSVDYETVGELSISTDPNLTSLTSNLVTNFADVRSLLINSTNGIFTQVSKMIDPLTGSIMQQIQNSVTTTNQDEVQLARKILDEQDRLNAVQAELTQKWSAVNVMLQKFNDMSDYLGKQIDSLKINSSNN